MRRQTLDWVSKAGFWVIPSNLFIFSSSWPLLGILAQYIPACALQQHSDMFSRPWIIQFPKQPSPPGEINLRPHVVVLLLIFAMVGKDLMLNLIYHQGLAVLTRKQSCWGLGLGFPVSRTVRKSLSVVWGTQFMVLCYGGLNRLRHLQSHTCWLPGPLQKEFTDSYPEEMNATNSKNGAFNFNALTGHLESICWCLQEYRAKGILLAIEKKRMLFFLAIVMIVT